MSVFDAAIERKLGSKQIAVTWLGQAGYLIQAANGINLIIDPYLSDYCEVQLGRAFKRLMPAMLTAEEIDQLSISAYLMTHHHEDHLDPPIIRNLKRSDYNYYAPPITLELVKALGVSADRLRPLQQGSRHEEAGFSVTGTFADHGELAPDAVGIIIEIAGKVIFHMGDTCFNTVELEKIRAQRNIDLLIVPINGRYGNMNEAEAAEAVRILQPRQTVPCHFWMLPANSGGDPALFLELAGEKAPDTTASLFMLGETIVIE